MSFTHMLQLASLYFSSFSIALLLVSLRCCHAFVLIRLQQLHLDSHNLAVSDSGSEDHFSENRAYNESNTEAHTHASGLSTCQPHIIKESVKIEDILKRTIC